MQMGTEADQVHQSPGKKKKKGLGAPTHFRAGGFQGLGELAFLECLG
jgi:hypothetical protein